MFWGKRCKVNWTEAFILKWTLFLSAEVVCWGFCMIYNYCPLGYALVSRPRDACHDHLTFIPLDSKISFETWLPLSHCHHTFGVALGEEFLQQKNKTNCRSLGNNIGTYTIPAGRPCSQAEGSEVPRKEASQPEVSPKQGPAWATHWQETWNCFSKFKSSSLLRKPS